MPERVRQVQLDAAPCAVIGLSSVCCGAAAFATGFSEALQAVRGAAVRAARRRASWPTRSSGRTSTCCGWRRNRASATTTATRSVRCSSTTPQHRSQLFRTLEEYLRQRGRVASTAAALYVHPNTLRQRLARIETITGLDLETEDSLTVEMAMKLLKLEAAGS